MKDLVPIIAVALICMSGLALLAALPRPHNVSATVREFAGKPPRAVPSTVEEPETTKSPAQFAGINFDMFNDATG